MSVGKVSTGQEGYYLSAVAQGAEDYYSERGEVPGRWIGFAADELGLEGDVDDDAFRAVLSVRIRPLVFVCVVGMRGCARLI